MKIKDLLESQTHAVMPRSYRTASKPTMVVNMDQYYEYYRFLVSVAGLPEKDDIPIAGPLEDGPYIVPYSEIEKKHCLDVLKKMNKSIEYIDRDLSREMDKVNKVSPVRQFKDYDK